MKALYLPASLVLGILFAVFSLYAQQPSDLDINRMFSRRVKVEPRLSPSKGDFAAQVTIIEFSDFECSYCRRAAAVLDSLLAQYPGQVRVVYKNFPLPFHKHASLAAKAGIAAAKQGKFWEMHDLLFDNQNSLEQPTFVSCAKKLNLDLRRFNADLMSAETDSSLQLDMKLAREAGVNSTPTFILNGVVVRGAYSAEYFKPIIDRLLLEPPPGVKVIPLTKAQVPG